MTRHRHRHHGAAGISALLVLLILASPARAQPVQASAADFHGTWTYQTAQQAGLGSVQIQGTVTYKPDGTAADAGTMTLTALDAVTRERRQQSLEFTVEKRWLVSQDLLVETVTDSAGGDISGGGQVIPFDQIVPVGSQTAMTIVQVTEPVIVLTYQGQVITLIRRP